MKNPTEPTYRWLFWSLTVLGLLLDQASKYGVFLLLYNGDLQNHWPLIPGAFHLQVQYTGQRDPGEGLWSRARSWSGDMLPQVNQGALFGLGGRWGIDSNMVFAVVSVLAAMGIIYWCMRSHTARDRFLCLALGLILAGTLGNLYDRLVFGGVRDFLYWYYLIDWPVFNVADCCLVCGAGLLLLQAFFSSTSESSLVPNSADV
jgi:signal peptidase II